MCRRRIYLLIYNPPRPAYPRECKVLHRPKGKHKTKEMKEPQGINGPQCPSDKVSVLGLKGTKFETKFHRKSDVYVGPLHSKSYVLPKCLPAGGVQKFGEEGVNSDVTHIIWTLFKIPKTVPK
ncbi:hypothetical protein AVEN_58413-1 [Araneus ventricosus]|uniref:Uncharacterized protein n=1 Tax=Araneus ventricosus TaxID=182803 RepID=A0A4Y2F2V1_ARAVE|nr:hypothetical protein AVEN_58413-1 [Araneus ventricosus]